MRYLLGTRSKLLFAILMTLLLPPCSVLLQAQTAAPQSGSKTETGQNPKSPEAAPYHKGQHEGTDWNSSNQAAKPLQPVAAHARSVPLTKIEILPRTVAITGPRYKQRVVVEGTFADGHEEDVTAQARLTTSMPKVAEVDKDAMVRPQGDGQASLVATIGSLQATAPIEVNDFAKTFLWGFRNDVLPVMTKMGCNSGACHGAAAGKNGFKLTLRGFDPETDYFTLTHQALARRTERLEPAKSLILLKPTLTIPHGGGRRFPVGSLEYQIMSGWIADGMPAPQASDPRVTDIQVLPREASLVPGAEQQLLVTATFSDGHTEDVTPWTLFSSGDMGVASVDPNGKVTMRGYGEAPITVWYQSHVTFARVRIPYPYQLDEAVFEKAPHHNYIDEFVLAHLKQLHMPPSRPATDAEFIRRAYLDAAGILPKPAEVEQFLKDTSPDKRSRLISQLIDRPEFVDYWAYKWSDLLMVSSNKLSRDGMWSYYDWIRDGVAGDKAWNKFVWEIVTANGNAREDGPVNYWVIHRDPKDISENMAQIFLGTSIQCAHCHNHPLDKWTQRDYYGMANLFARVRLKTSAPSGSIPNVGPIFRDVTLYTGPGGQYTDDRFSRPLPPKPLGAQALGADSPLDPRVYFGEWLTSPKNPLFARNIVNRIWANFMGRGLVEPVDDLRATNPPTNENLLNALCKDFVAHNYDVDYLIRTLMESATYQTSSQPNQHNADDDKYYSHYLIRRLPAEVLLDAYSQVTQVPEKFEDYPAGTRALQLPDTAVQDYFLTAFGRPSRQTSASSDRTSVPSITQALHIINGDTLNNKLRDPHSSIEMLLKLGFSDEEIVKYFFLAAFDRYPTEAELHALVGDLRQAEVEPAPGSQGSSRHAALTDMAWAMLTSKEFMFNH
ncbi:MAG: DUF1553 domain-containing protein [Acidobacteriia bacterium]|nr:DUF1553 domain-containing protein [Terriglobia bacterium]